MNALSIITWGQYDVVLPQINYMPLSRKISEVYVKYYVSLYEVIIDRRRKEHDVLFHVLFF